MMHAIFRWRFGIIIYSHAAARFAVPLRNDQCEIYFWIEMRSLCGDPANIFGGVVIVLSGATFRPCIIVWEVSIRTVGIDMLA